MPTAKDIIVKPISSTDANRLVRKFHYSGKVVNNSQLHFGVFLGDSCGGAMSFGPPLDRRKLLGLVRGTKWNEMLELNRMAFGDLLPRNSESRALAVAFRLIRKAYPHIQWVVSFADAAQCGDGTIYRAAGFVLTGITKNAHLYRLPDGRITHVLNYEPGRGLKNAVGSMCATAGLQSLGAKRVVGFQLRYLYFLDPSARERLTVPVLPFSKIAEMGAGMYKGKPRAAGVGSDTPGVQPGEGGATPTAALSPTRGA